jgi:hypothetical protein
MTGHNGTVAITRDGTKRDTPPLGGVPKCPGIVAGQKLSRLIVRVGVT